ncbi:MAG: peptide chain release factor N(5)-glutamine methyltransferase [Bacillota bacterium]
MNIGQWLIKAGKYLEKRNQGAGRIDAEVLLAHAVGMDRVSLYREGLMELSREQEALFRSLVERRAAGEPAAYITGRKEFMGLDFAVSPAVLIPRPETELLVEVALGYLKKIDLSNGAKPPLVVDVGTGSGAIAVSLAVKMERAKIYATDISPAALKIARENAKRLAGEKVEFIPGDLMDSLKAFLPRGSVDLVTANLPYVPTGDIQSLMADVRDYEPRLALDGGADGLDLYRRLVPEAFEMLSPGGLLLMEIDPGQVRSISKILGSRWIIQVFKDLAGRERLISAEKDNTNPE